ncbi:hypothetical protein C8Q75DRAFT_805003 [Abortiporus biennis]|nr:hypothetical protein C8Q75DRAFT_805003 [Abortiporus biennis]
MRPLEEYENRITVWRATQGFTYRSVEDDLIGSWIRLKRFFAIMEGFHTIFFFASHQSQKTVFISISLCRVPWIYRGGIWTATNMCMRVIQQFLKDVIDALQTSVCQVMVPPHYRGVLYLRAPPHPLWSQQLISMWRLNPKVPAGHVINMCNEVYYLISQHTTPKYQKLLLHHLPVELLSIIIRDMDKHTVRSFGSTSKLLRTISVPFVYRNVELRLRKFSLGGVEAAPDGLEEMRRQMICAYHSRDVLVSRLTLLQSFPNVLGYIQSLTVNNEWRGTPLAWTQLTPLLELFETLYQPIIDALGTLIRHTLNIKHVGLSHILIHGEFPFALANIPTLRTVELLMCKIVAPRMDSLPNPYIHNLIFAHPASKDGDSDIWAFLHLVPSIRVLSLFGLDKENSLSVTSLDPLSSQIQID